MINQRLFQRSQTVYYKSLVCASQKGYNVLYDPISLNLNTKRNFNTRNNRKYNQQQEENRYSQRQKQLNYILLGSLFATFLYHNSQKEANCEENESEKQEKVSLKKAKELNQEDEEEEELQEGKEKLKQIYQKIVEPLEIPKLLLEREKQKMKEYQEREEIDVQEIEKMTKDEALQMKQLDGLFWQSKQLIDEEYGQDEDEQSRIDGEQDQLKDPYLRKKNSMMKHQEYRKIEVGGEDLLKNGQMIQVSVCDPFNENYFHPTDKVIIVKHFDKYYAFGSFCGFDYTNLATGALLGEKVVCPTCGSSYNIKNGFVEQGPSLRNISNFLIQNREERIFLITPEHIPAFAKKAFVKKANIDPRTFVIIGDSETALSAIDALRTNYTGRIVVIPTSPFGSFENQDILTKKFSPINKNEIFMVEEDYLDRANVDVIRGSVSKINLALGKRQIIVSGQKKPIEFDKILIAWGSFKQRIKNLNDKQYSNVYYIEDRQSHAKVHNEILKAKTIVILGSTFEAYQTASSIRSYLDSIDYKDVQIVLMNSGESEVHKCLGKMMTNLLHGMLKDQRISVLQDVEISKMIGMNKLTEIHFEKKNLKVGEKKQRLFLKPDLVIAENGVGSPKHDLRQMVGEGYDSGDKNMELSYDQDGVPSCDIRFSLHYNDLATPILAAGSCTKFNSFMHKIKMRTNDVKYNIESGFYAAMNMMDKRVEFRYIPISPLKLGDHQMYFIGERVQGFSEIIINGSVENKKFVAYFIYGNEVAGILTCGYQNLHLYLWEAMKLLIFPSAQELRTSQVTYKDIVKNVLKMRPLIECQRHEVIKIPSMVLAETDPEIDQQTYLRMRIKQNIERENEIQKQKFEELKQKYDREGVEFIKDEMDIGEGGKEEKRLEMTRSGKGYKPSRRNVKSDIEEGREQNINMGGDNDNLKNPFNMVINMAKKTFNG